MISHPRLRPVTEADESFLETAFVSGRPELCGLPRELLQLQLRAQRRQYVETYPCAVEHLVVVGDDRVGRCIVSRDLREDRLLDITLVNAYRGLGIGTALILGLLEQAAGASVPLRLSVWSANTGAVRLYHRLGFQPVGEQGGYMAMQAVPVASDRMFSA